MADVWLGTWQQCIPYIQNFRRGIDVGFRGGDFAKNMLPYFDDVVGFEFRLKSKKFKVENLLVYGVALGDSETTSFTSMNAGRIKGSGPREVKIKKLDSYGYTDVDFIKIDVEGYEPKATPYTNKFSQWLLESWGYELQEVDHLQGHDFIFTRSDWEPE